jgi:hypothetical protein
MSSNSNHSIRIGMETSRLVTGPISCRCLQEIFITSFPLFPSLLVVAIPQISHLPCQKSIATSQIYTTSPSTFSSSSFSEPARQTDLLKLEKIGHCDCLDHNLVSLATYNTRNIQGESPRILCRIVNHLLYCQTAVPYLCT